MFAMNNSDVYQRNVLNWRIVGESNSRKAWSAALKAWPIIVYHFTENDMKRLQQRASHLAPAAEPSHPCTTAHQALIS